MLGESNRFRGRDLLRSSRRLAETRAGDKAVWLQALVVDLRALDSRYEEIIGERHRRALGRGDGSHGGLLTGHVISKKAAAKRVSSARSRAVGRGDGPRPQVIGDWSPAPTVVCVMKCGRYAREGLNVCDRDRARMRLHGRRVRTERMGGA